MTKIRDFPELHNQEHFGEETECGTAHCLGGWACALSGYQFIPESFGLFRNPDTGDELGGWNLARDLLGLNAKESLTLFAPGNTRSMLEQMVKEIANGEELRDWEEYW